MDEKTYEVTTDFLVSTGEPVLCKRGKGTIAYQQGQFVRKGEQAILSAEQLTLYKSSVKTEARPKSK